MTVGAAPQGEFYSDPNPKGAVVLPNSPSVGEWKSPARSQTDVAPQPILPHVEHLAWSKSEPPAGG